MFNPSGKSGILVSGSLALLRGGDVFPYVLPSTQTGLLKAGGSCSLLGRQPCPTRPKLKGPSCFLIRTHAGPLSKSQVCSDGNHFPPELPTFWPALWIQLGNPEPKNSFFVDNSL